MKKALPIILAAILLMPNDYCAQFKKKDKSKANSKEQVKEEKKDEDKFSDLTKKCHRSDGLLTMWRDSVSGKTYLEVREDQLGKEFIYFNHIIDAPVEAGYFRGSYGGSKIISFNKSYDMMDIIQQNTSFYYNPESEISKAANANINDPILASEKIEATSKDKKSYLMDGDAIFLSEKFQLIKMPTPPGAPAGALGSLSSSKSRIARVKNYPQNTEVDVTYVYENASPTIFSGALADPRNITIKFQHTILEVPSNNFKPRRDDPRIGYFATQINDMTSFSPTPYKDVIHKWNLEKKDIKAKISDPIEPITYWIENTTPKELRAIIKEACESWNVAFEQAGFSHAVVCKVQPDDAGWDAGDIRYNVLRWTSSPMPPFGGYGPSFVNPRTGEILGADIMLEFTSIVSRVNAEKIFKSTGFLNDETLNAESEKQIRNPFLCSASHHTNHNLIFGATAAAVLGMDEAAQKEIVKQLLFRLVLHEVGHTLGLTHNMCASTMSSLKDVKDPEKVTMKGLTNSVMEYPAFNYQLNPNEQTLYCDTRPGLYDLWVIEYGYSPTKDDPLMEELQLKRITDRSTDENLMYGNDADDMRSSGKGIDPDVNIYDLTNDPVAYAAERCELINAILPKLKSRFEKNQQSYEELLDSYLIATGEYGNQIRIMTRQIGGVHIDRSFIGQNTTVRPFEPVTKEKQKAAMSALAKYAFSADAFNASGTLYNFLMQQRRGFSHFSKNEDPHIHQRVLAMQVECLNQLLHENVLLRITDSQLYGNTYKLDEVMTDLTNAIFQYDLKTGVSTFRQNLQIEYVQKLIDILNPKTRYDNISQSMALSEMKRIEELMTTAAAPDGLTKAHREFVKATIKKSIESR